MDQWSIDRYARPYVALDEIMIEDRVPVVVTATGCFELETDAPPEELVSLITAMRDPAWDGWRDRDAHAPLLMLFDRYGFLQDAREDAPEAAAAEKDRLLDGIDHAAAWLAEAIAASPGGGVQAAARHVLAHLDAAGGAVPDAGDNFHLALASRLIGRWRQVAPLVLVALRVLLAHPCVRVAPPSRAAEAELDRLAGGFQPYDSVVQQLSDMCFVLVLASGVGARRLLTPRGNAAGRRAGLPLAIDAERAIGAHVAALPPSRFWQGLQYEETASRLAAGIYLHQYHVSERYVDVMLPMMARRTAAGLRDKLRGYYAEEIGHERMELEACRSLGLDPEVVTNSVPLPLFSAYLDALAHIGATDPLGFLMAVLVAEGLPAYGVSPHNAILARQGIIPHGAEGVAIREHESVNVVYDHVTLTRRMMADIPSVAAEDQDRAFDDLAFMVELNFRSWELLWKYYATGTKPVAPQPFSCSGREVVGWAVEP